MTCVIGTRKGGGGLTSFNLVRKVRAKLNPTVYKNFKKWWLRTCPPRRDAAEIITPVK